MASASSLLGADEVKTPRRRNSIDKPPNMSVTRIVLVGKTGAGKSSSGNTIMGREAFRAAARGASVTKECGKQTEEVDERKMTLIDTPGLFDTSLPEDYLRQEIGRCINMSAPGPHAIVVVIRLGPFTAEERSAVERIQEIFGPEAVKYVLILFTHGDELTETIEEYLQNSEEDLQQLVEKCGKRYHVFNNTDMSDRKQVLDLLDKIDAMVAANSSTFYSSAMYQEVERRIREKEEELREFYEQKMREKEEELKIKYLKEKKTLEKKIQSLEGHLQKKEQKIKEMEREAQMKKLEERQTRELKESRRYYTEKQRNTRQEAEKVSFLDEALIEYLKSLSLNL